MSNANAASAESTSGEAGSHTRLDLDDRKFALEEKKIALEEKKLALELEKNARARWWHEDHLVNHRQSWLLVSQALLFAAFGTLAKSDVRPTPLSCASSVMVTKALDAIPVAGIVVGIMVLIATSAACWAQYKLHAEYKGSIADFQLGVSRQTTLLGWAPSILMPTAFISVWAWLAYKV